MFGLFLTGLGMTASQHEGMASAQRAKAAQDEALRKFNECQQEGGEIIDVEMREVVEPKQIE